MDFTRNLKKGTSGEDVLFCKQKLLELGYYADHITTVTRKTFGADTLEAVKRFQTQAGLTVD
nr:peptidoglycan-binding domain-containing protein [bacterium]